MFIMPVLQRVLKVSWLYLSYALVLVALCFLAQLKGPEWLGLVYRPGAGAKWKYEDIFVNGFDPPVLLNGQVPVEVRSDEDVLTNGFNIVCYYIVRSGLLPEAVDPYDCTHIIIGFSALLNSTIQPSQAEDIDIYRRVVKLKKANPSLKVLLSVAEMSSAGEFSQMVSRSEYREKFVNETLAFLKSMDLDGLDLDWEFPSWPNANLNQAVNFTQLLKGIRDKIESHYGGMLLSAAVGAPALVMQQSYEIQEMSKYVDFVNIMSYDYHQYSPYLPLTGPNAPLFSRPKESMFLETFNTNWSATHWALWGMPFSKINVGIPTYGHSYRLLNEDNNGWAAPASGFGSIGIQGFTSFVNACKFTADPETSHFFDENYQVPYAFRGSEWLSYEDLNSVRIKALYIQKMKFGGAMIYSLNSDDFSGSCGGRKFALTRAVNDILSQVS